MLRAGVGACVSGAAGGGAGAAREPVDLELVLLADATGSIDDVETALQRQGYADGDGRPRRCSGRSRTAASTGGSPSPTWSGRAPRSQDVVVDWMVVEDEAQRRDLRRRG